MRRMHFSEEQTKEIIQLYLDGISQYALAKKYGCSRAPINRVLKENDIQIRGVKVANSKQVSEKEIQEIVYHYSILKESLHKIGILFNYSPETIKKILLQKGVQIRTYVEAKDLTRKYSLDDDFFKKQNHNMAYVLGFIAADGNVAKKENGIFIEIHQKDKYLLQKINEITQNTRPLKYYNHKHPNGTITPVVKFRAWSSVWKKDLAIYNIVPEKSLVLKPPLFLQKKFIISYIKGYFDGDGCIYYHKRHKRYECQIIGASKELIDWIRTFLATEYGIVGTYYTEHLQSGAIMYKITYANQNLVKLKTLWYEQESSEIELLRKKAIFNNI